MKLTSLGMVLALTLSMPVSAQTTRNPLALNQTGFTPTSPKIAVYVSDRTEALEWALKNASGKVVARGKSRYFGRNDASGEGVHQIDFSQFMTPGKGYVLTTDGTESAPFAIESGIYRSLKYDALAFFYHQRVSVPIEAKYVGERWARPVAHATEAVTCWGPKDFRGNEWGGCGYTLKAPKGWYDAGDHGKYVVNGGIAVWTLMNAYEHGLTKGSTAFADGKVKIPEAGNGQNDLLDEVRFEMDFMMAMQVPDGETLTLPLGDQRGQLKALTFTRVDASGMAHHKLHDEHWTAVPTLPHEDKETRGLSYPSTAATLNLAATAAQCARLFKGVDDLYASQCLSVARKAYAAALRVPEAYAIDVLEGGGGGYGDGDVSDEFYWAAAELFLTTGEAPFAAAMKASKHYLSAPLGDKAATGDISWARVQALGTISLAVAKDSPLRKEAQGALVKTADAYAAQAAGQGYAIAFDRAYVWGSNADFANRAMILALAADFTGNSEYRAQVVNLIDYILGRNPLSFSYVSGYGVRSLAHPHHRFWANDAKLPGPPPGVLSGGPNQRPSDTGMAEAFKGCLPQTCYLDVIGSYSTNEVAVNWNAPLFWVAAWLDEPVQ